MYFNAWTAKEVHKYDLKEGKETGMVKLDFMPDNISWTSKRTMLAAGVKGTGGDCPAGSGDALYSGVQGSRNRPRENDSEDGFRLRGQRRADFGRL